MQQKLQRSHLKIFLITGLLLWEGLCFSQDTESANHPGSEGSEVIQEEHDTKDLEKLLKRYNTDQEKVLEDSSKIHHIENDEGTSEIKDSEIEEMRPEETLAHAKEAAVARAVKDRAQREKEKNLEKINSDLVESVKAALEPLQKLSEDELLKRVDEGTKDSFLRPYVVEFPNIMLFSVRLLKDKESIPSIFKIILNKQKLIYFISVMLFTIVFGFLLKRFMHREGRSFIKATFYFLIRLVFMFALRIAVIYYFYREELTPAAKIFKKTFL